MTDVNPKIFKKYDIRGKADGDDAVVTKEVAGGRTHSRLREVAGKARQEEIARMLGGKTDSALKHATTLLKR